MIHNTQCRVQQENIDTHSSCSIKPRRLSVKEKFDETKIYLLEYIIYTLKAIKSCI